MEGIFSTKKLDSLTPKLLLFHAIITHIYDNNIKFEVSLHFWRIWPTVRHVFPQIMKETREPWIRSTCPTHSRFQPFLRPCKPVAAAEKHCRESVVLTSLMMIYEVQFDMEATYTFTRMVSRCSLRQLRHVTQCGKNLKKCLIWS